MPYNILLVDDDVNQAYIVEKIIHDKMHYKTRLVENGQEAINILTSKDTSDIDLVLLDLSMPGISGVDVLNAVKPVKPNLPIIVRTGYDDIDMAVEAMKAGATDFLKKVDSADRLKESINHALQSHKIHDELSLQKRASIGRTSFSNIIGDSHAIKEMVELGRKVSASNIPVLLEGESGSGKELLARAIHEESPRSGKPFIAVNCGAIPENLVESILFGHEKGAFTGALYKTFGKFREADGGTIFLDEIGELPADIQVKLLRALQDGEIDSVGSEKPVKVDVRVISATNRNLAEEVKEGRFREDLYYRLNVFPIRTPALRERSGDMSLLVSHFIKSFNNAEGKHVTGIESDAEDMLRRFNWPGNIRQLKNAIYRAVVLCESDKLAIKDFHQITEAMKNNSPVEEAGAVSFGGIGMQDSKGHYRKLCEIEKDVILSALRHYKGRMSEVARRLGIGRSTLYRKLEEFDISHEESFS